MVPESPRWLIGMGRFDEALKILKGGAKVNKKTLPPDSELLDMMEKVKQAAELEEEEADNPETFKEKVIKEMVQSIYILSRCVYLSSDANILIHDPHFLQLLDAFKELTGLVKTPEMRKRTLNVFFSWLAVAMVYYGLSFNTKNLGGDRYLSSFVSGFVEVIRQSFEINI